MKVPDYKTYLLLLQVEFIVRAFIIIYLVNMKRLTPNPFIYFSYQYGFALDASDG